MKRNFKELIGYILLFSAFIVLPIAGSQSVTVLSNKTSTRSHVIIDAGHGGVDGGAVSCTGIHESQINLEIAMCLKELMNLLGLQTLMIRDCDISVHTQGNTIAAKKVSDIRERVRIVNTTPNALLVSIHQNIFSDPKYSGAQVFYNNNPNSRLLAEQLQTAFQKNVNPSNRRQCKKTTGVYLMEHINCSGILIECGFLSNPQEEMLLRNSEYQKKLCCVIAATISQYLNT